MSAFSLSRVSLVAGLCLCVGSWAQRAWAQEDYSGPTIVAPAPATAPASTEKPAPSTSTPTTPANAPAAPVPTPATMPTEEAALQNLLHPAPAAVIPSSGGPILNKPKTAASQPSATRLREGEKVIGRVGRLVKDDKTGLWMFAFEADGRDMRDPPMGLVPCRYLEAMERLSEEGKKAVKFKVSGEVTEYHDKNYLYVQFMQVVRDLNQF